MSSKKAAKRRRKEEHEHDALSRAAVTRAAAPLFDAARCGDLEAMGRLIDQQPSTRPRRSRSSTGTSSSTTTAQAPWMWTCQMDRRLPRLRRQLPRKQVAGLV